MKKLFVSAISFFCFASVFAQEDVKYPRYNVGFGLGIDYGGIGGRLSVLPVSQVAVFGGLGYNLNGAGYNVGAAYRLSPAKRFCPYVIGMYGYNAVIIVSGSKSSNRTYYGPSVGMGFEKHKSAGSKNYFNFEVLVPFRSSAYKKYKDDLEDDTNSKIISLPIAISIGYHVGI